MSQPQNPDARPLPPGWIQQYDRNYNTWFYVNTTTNPPQSSWTHPAGPAPPPPANFAPPAGPPPPNSPYGQQPYPPQSGYGQSPPPQQYGGGYGSGYGGYGSPPPQQSYGGGYPENRGFFGGGAPPQQQQPQVVYQQAPPKKSGPGMGTALLAGGAGLVGGALLADAFEDHEDREEREAYDQGYNDGQDNDYGGGDDW
ncbi:hypothetical protein BC629DRAFT_1597274 [Irpex lacteus]|nr:hypothetical protein BC629DRAFT_1597274 [Irpex lacteus]